MVKLKSLPVELPMESPNWVQLIDAYRTRYQQVGLDPLTLIDIQQALEDTHRPLRTKICQLVDGQHTETQPTTAFWQDIKLIRWDQGLRLISSTGKRLLGVIAIYVWWPDFKMIFGGEVAPPASTEGPSETPAATGTSTRKKGTKGYAEEDWELLMVKCFTILNDDAVKPNTDVSIRDVTKRVREWWKKRVGPERTPGRTQTEAQVKVWVALYKRALPLDD